MKILLLFSFLYISIFSKLQSTTTWDAYTLYDYTNARIKNGTENVKYMIIDPDEILNTTSKSAILSKMNSFYIDKSVINYIIIFYKMSNTITNLESLVNTFSSKMNMGVAGYSIDNSLISAFAIEDRLSTIKTGETVKKSLSDSTVKTILNNRKTELQSGNYDKAMEDLINDIINNYGKSDSGSDDSGGSKVWWTVIKVIAVILLVLLFIFCKCVCGIDLSVCFGSGHHHGGGHHGGGGGGHHGGGGGYHGGGGGASSSW